MRKAFGKRKNKQLAFRSLIDPRNCSNLQSKRIYEEVRKASGRVPEIYRVKGLADNANWLRLVHHSVFQWPRSCSLDEKTKELVGLAKSIAYLWEPGVLTNIEGALQAGASPEEIVEAVLVTSTVLGLADVDVVISAASLDFAEIASVGSSAEANGKTQETYRDANKTFGSVPELYKSKLLIENVDWLTAIHRSAKIQYSPGTLDQKTKALICLAASSARRWDRGIREHLNLAVKSGATAREIVDVLSSIYKTAASIGIQIGFGVPCSIPQISGFRLIRDYYPGYKGSQVRAGRGRR